MRSISVFSKDTGQIVATVTCCEGDEHLQYDPEVCGLVDGTYSSNEYYVCECVVTRMPERPSQYHQFNYQTGEWVDTRDTAFYEAEARAKRQQLLAASDWTQLPDVPLATKEAWATYRQALRDITEQPGFPMQIVWPTPPA